MALMISWAHILLSATLLLLEQAQTATQGVSAAITKFSNSRRGVAISNKSKPDCIVDMLQNLCFQHLVTSCISYELVLGLTLLEQLITSCKQQRADVSLFFKSLILLHTELIVHFLDRDLKFLSGEYFVYSSTSIYLQRLICKNLSIYKVHKSFWAIYTFVYLCLCRWVQNVDGGVMNLLMCYCTVTTPNIPIVPSACTISPNLKLLRAEIFT